MLGRVLRPEELRASAHHDYALPAPQLLPWVERYWSVHWRLEPGQVFHTATVTEPALNLTYEVGGVQRAGQSGAGFWLTGPVKRRRFDVELSGRGSVLGIKLRVGAGPGMGIAYPGALLGKTAEAVAWFPEIASDWTALGLIRGEDESTNADVDNKDADGPTGVDSGAAFPRVQAEALAASAAKSALDIWLSARIPAPDPGYDRFRSLLAMLDDSATTRLDVLAMRAGCSVRTLERLFARYAGVGPKWLLTRARVIDAVMALDVGTAEPLADLATRLGWFDQAHFTSDFHRIVGETPEAYRKRNSGK